jgi:hypothetical protein
MKQRYILFFTAFLFTKLTIGQSASDMAVQLSAQVQLSPAQITLNWASISGATSYFVYRKTKDAAGWGAYIGTTAGTSFTDNTISVGQTYEYKVAKQNSPYATGYIYAGINAPPIHNRGALLLLVDTTFTTSCSTEIAQLTKDISGDGWEVIRNDFGRSVNDITIRNYIVSKYPTTNLKAVLILGHLDVPYSGEINPDGHTDHIGAWPADVYYADVNDIWTDVSVNNTSASRTQNDNIPGDGKWDQSITPGPVELQVGRIDFANMPTFAKTETQMMQSYLTKAHQYKVNQLPMVKRALIDDNFGYFSGEAFAANGWRNFPVLVSKDSIKSSLDLITTLNTDQYQWSYGTGGGTYTSAGGIGNTANFAANNVNSIFTVLFGSYFGDWDAQDNFLRAPLCSNTPALASFWAGRPNWFLHHMALGENIGYSAMLTQNNTYAGPLYTPSNFGAQFVHVALMGDPTLRTDYIIPPTAVTLTNSTGAGAVVNWSASTDGGVIGYYVYRSTSEFGKYEQRSQMITGTSFTDSSGDNGTKYYMVRAVKLQQTPSGTYYNLSLGMTSAPANITYPIPASSVEQLKASGEHLAVYPIPASRQLNLFLANIDAPMNSQVTISNMQGKIIYAVTKQLAKGGNLVTIDISALPAGLYMVTVPTKTAVYTRKWVKTD